MSYMQESAPNPSAHSGSDGFSQTHCTHETRPKTWNQKHLAQLLAACVLI